MVSVCVALEWRQSTANTAAQISIIGNDLRPKLISLMSWDFGILIHLLKVFLQVSVIL